MTPFIEPIDWDWNDDQDQVDAFLEDREAIQPDDLVLCDGVWYVVEEIEWDMMPETNEWYCIYYCLDQECVDVVLHEGMIESVNKSIRSIA